jgi:hypothetical protein
VLTLRFSLRFVSHPRVAEALAEAQALAKGGPQRPLRLPFIYRGKGDMDKNQPLTPLNM